MSKKVLIADDGLFFRAALKDILTRGGYEVVGEAENGEQALVLASELKPDIVILDIVMPVMNGIEAAREITMLNLPLKIVMCTSLGFEAIAEEAIRSGASGYIIKPLSEAKVLHTLKTLHRAG